MYSLFGAADDLAHDPDVPSRVLSKDLKKKQESMNMYKQQGKKKKKEVLVIMVLCDCNY